MASFSLFFSAPSEVPGEVRLCSNRVSVRSTHVNTTDREHSRWGGGLWAVVFAGVPQGPGRRKETSQRHLRKTPAGQTGSSCWLSQLLSNGVSREDLTPVTGRREERSERASTHSFRIHWALRVGKVPSSGPEIQCVQEKRHDPLLVKRAVSGDELQANTGHHQ